MNKEELIERLRKETGLAFYNPRIANRDDYTELEFQQMKADLQQEMLDYSEKYVDYEDNDVTNFEKTAPGTDEILAEDAEEEGEDD
jgi:DNA-directed RNA polymerase specialized sigma subunit